MSCFTGFGRSHPKLNRFARSGAVLFAVSFAWAPASNAGDRAWFGSNGDWGNALNWTPAAVPGVGDRAIIGAGTSTLDFDTLVSAFDLSGGALAGTGDLSISGASLWGGGTLSGASTVTFGAGLTISGAATKTLLGGRILNLNGITSWSGNTANNNNAIRFWNGGTLNNNGTFNDANAFDSFIEHNVGGPHNFNNVGAYNKQSATITTVDIGVAFNNTGTVNVNAGTFRPSGGTSSGTFNIAAGAVLDFRNGANTLNNITTSGAGTLQISTDNVGSDATVTLNGGTHTTAVVLSGSTLNGTDQVFQGAFTWSGGTIGGAASTSFNGGLTISGPNLKTILGGRILNLTGTTSWSGNTANNNNAIRFWNGGTLNNNGTFNDANAFDSFIEHNVGGPHNFNNAGTYNKQSATITTVDIGVAFNNTGTVNVNAGTFRPSGGTSSGTFNIAAGAVLDFRNGANTLNNITTSGAGTLQISTDNVGSDATVTLNGGTHTTAVVLSGSTLNGTDQVFQGAFTWSGGTIGGAASTSFNGGLTISGPNLKTILGGRILNLTGTTSWSGNTANNNNAIRFWNGGTLNNNGTFNDANAFDSFIEHNVGGPHNFNNAGTYNKQSATITTVDIGVAFNNTGTVNVNAGTFRPSGGTSSGTFNIAAGAVLDFRNGANTLNNITTSGAGTLQISTDNIGADGSLTLNGGTHTTAVVLSGGTLTGSDHTFQGPFTWSGGTISGSASTTISGTLAVSGANTKTILGGRTLNLNGTTTWSGNTAANNNAIRFWNGGTLNNNGTFNDANTFASFIEHNSGGPHNFNNVGTYNKQVDTVTTFDLGIALHNTGTINANAGTIQVSSAFTNEGRINVAAGATFSGLNATFANGASGVFAGNGTFATQTNGDILNDGIIAPGFSIGSLTLEGDLRQGATGRIQIEVGAGRTSDVLTVSDDVILAGSLVAVNAGYVPVIGDRIPVLHFDQRLSDSKFSAVTTLGYGSGVVFDAIYDTHDVSLLVVAVPEPQTYVMFLGGLALIGAALRRRRTMPA